MIEPLVCTVWDGTNIWLQWTPVENPPADLRYGVRVRFRKIGEEQWGDWIYVEGSGRRAWQVVATWRQDALCQAQVAVGRESWRRAQWVAEGQYEAAQEVTFLRSHADFQFSTGPRPFAAVEGSEFAAVVDGGACHYRLTKDVELAPQQSTVARMEAAVLSGFCQLDAAGDFRVRPYLGVSVVNTGPSSNDVQGTGRDFGQILSLPPGPMRIAFAPPSRAL